MARKGPRVREKEGLQRGRERVAEGSMPQEWIIIHKGRGVGSGSKSGPAVAITKCKSLAANQCALTYSFNQNGAILQSTGVRVRKRMLFVFLACTPSAKLYGCDWAIALSLDSSHFSGRIGIFLSVENRNVKKAYHQFYFNKDINHPK